ncbi:flagellar assembly protein FliW [Paenibacillus brevis]|uniref:Flagellar assembly factor FliW n=1 Tax=Paenibacillus brevis TaxID=2841508 RepID=A0ABS6FP23_9BACL|nr:flagellar assembly protein FliW [Paenibacillus brevis]MBU5670951.1 flagellar assembly protein FliW [Paenibacillus brevis]
MLIRTARFGELEVNEQDLWTMKNPILGFESNRQFVVLPQNDSPFEYYQSIDDEHLTFVLADPFVFFNDYEFSLDQRWMDMLQIGTSEEVSVRVIVTVRSPRDISLNLKAPLVLNTRVKEAAQIILDVPGYMTRHSIVEQPKEEVKNADSFKK